MIWSFGRAQAVYAVLSCFLVLQLYQEAGVVAEGFTGVLVFQVRLRLQERSTSAGQRGHCWHACLCGATDELQLLGHQRQAATGLLAWYAGGGPNSEDRQSALHAAVPEQGGPGRGARQCGRPAVR